MSESIPGLPGIPPRQPVTDDLRAIIRLAVGAADYEILCMPPPRSRVPAPDGVPQTGSGTLLTETPAERTRRIVETVIMYAIENNLLLVPGDIAERLDDYFPAQRARA